MPRSKWRLTLTRNRGHRYFWLGFEDQLRPIPPPDELQRAGREAPTSGPIFTGARPGPGDGLSLNAVSSAAGSSILPI